jgi:hypothetical protein
MPTLSGISTGGSGNADVTVDITNNTLILNTLSFKGLVCDDLTADILQTPPQTTFDPTAAADSQPMWNVGKELARCRKVADLFETSFTPFSWPPFLIEGSEPIRTLRFTNGITQIWADSIKGPLADGTQTNITEVGTLSNLNVSGWSSLSNLSVSGTASVTDLNVGSLVDRLNCNNNKICFGASPGEDFDVMRISGKGGSTTGFAGVTNLNGVVIYGQSGGMLGGNSLGVGTTERCALRWWASGANASVGINTTSTPSGALDVNGDSYIRGRLYTNGVATAGTTMPQGLHAAWNFTTSVGETDFINKSGTGAGGFHFYNTTGDNTAFSVNTNLIATLTPSEGLLIPTNYVRSRQIFCRVLTSAVGNFTVVNTTASIFSSGAGGTNVTHDLRPSTMAVGGVTAGAYRLPVAGLYRITVSARFVDGAGGTKGLLLKRWNGTTATDLFGGDGVMWCPDDGAGRRTMSVSTVAQFAQLEEVYPTVHTANSIMVWAQMTIQFVSIP